VDSERLIKVSHFVNSDIFTLPFPKNTFHISIAHVMLCHFANPEQAFDELVRVTKRNGCVAIFDNALGAGGNTSWSSQFKPTRKQRLLDYEAVYSMIKGRKRLGQGDYSVGCYIPGWMEKRGFKNVVARCNERITWIAPPYKSPAQETALRNIRERFKEKTMDPKSPIIQRYITQLRAGGVEEKTIKKLMQRRKKQDRKFREAIINKTAAFTQSYGSFLCVWGFKP
jgi:SAM-dependent methyltransferase